MSVSFKSDEYIIFRNRLCNKTSLTMSSCVNKNDYMQPEMKNMGCICGDIWSNINTQKRLYCDTCTENNSDWNKKIIA